MSKDLTREQREAAECLDRNVLLSAGAGCGKTRTLVERYVNVLKAGLADVSGLVAITFTEKAASELEERVRERLARLRDEANDAATRSLWRRHLAAMESAEIGTIHSFCRNVLLEFAVEAGVDPDFAVLEEMEARTLREAAARDAVFDAVTAGDEAATRLVEDFGYASLFDMVTLALESRETVANFRERLDSAEFDVEEVAALLAERSGGIAESFAVESLSSSEFLKAFSFLSSVEGPADDALERKRRAFIKAHEAWRDSSREGYIEALKSICSAIGDLRSGSGKKWGDVLGDVKEAFKVIRKKARDALELFEGVALEDWTARAADVRRFIEVYDAALARYVGAKRVRGALDFDDLLILARDLVHENDRVKTVLAERYRFLLVDEFQDTDHVQEEIISALAASGSNTFVVGDPEQSIYGFRGAEVEVFNRVASRYEDSVESVVKRLSANYRSLPRVLGFVNRFFTDLMPAGSGLPEWRTSHQPLRAARDEPGRRIELICAETRGDMREGRRIEAETVAARIKEIVSTDSVLVYEQKAGGVEESRRPRRGDVAILVRSMGSVGIYERALEEAGLKYHTVAGSTFYMRQEVKDVVNLLRFLVDGSDSLSLVGALRSPLFAVSDDYLALLTESHALTDYFDEKLEPPGDGPDRDAFKTAVDLVRRLRARKNRLSVREVVDAVLDRTGFPAAVSMLFGGARRAANVLSLSHAAAAFDASAGAMLEDFVANLSELERREARESEAVVQSEREDVVRLMTIHAAKGLEFPVVVIADMGRARNRRSNPILIDRSLGICLTTPAKEKSPYLTLARKVEGDRDDAEERRLFYVAATRARDHLILSGAASKKPKGWLESVLSLLDIDMAKPGDYDLDSMTVEYSKATALKRRPHRRGAALPALRDDILGGKALGRRPPSGARGRFARAAVVYSGMAERKRFTATEIGDFLRCPLRFELAHLRGLPGDYVLTGERPGDRLPPHIVGTVLHETLAGVRRRENLADALERAIAAEPSYEPLAEALRRQSLPILKRVESSDFYRRIRQSDCERERSFSFLIGQSLFEGKIDLLLDDSLVDFKSDDIPAAEAPRYAERYRGQMDVYALAFEATRSVAPGAVTLFFLRSSAEVSWPYEEEGLSRASERVSAVVEAIRIGPPYAPVAACDRRCEYASLCSIIGERRSIRRRDSRPERASPRKPA